MKNPKIVKRNRDGVYSIEYYENHKRKVRSLGTKDKIEAGIRYSQLTGHLIAGNHVAESWSTPRTRKERKANYILAVNKFILSKWGLQDAWTAKNQSSQYNPAKMSVYMLKGLPIYNRMALNSICNQLIMFTLGV